MGIGSRLLGPRLDLTVERTERRILLDIVLLIVFPRLKGRYCLNLCEFERFRGSEGSHRSGRSVMMSLRLVWSNSVCVSTKNRCHHANRMDVICIGISARVCDRDVL